MINHDTNNKQQKLALNLASIKKIRLLNIMRSSKILNYNSFAHTIRMKNTDK